MIRTEFKRNNYKVVCDGCNKEINPNEPAYSIILGCDKYEDIQENVIMLCEDCGNDLLNDMSDEYCSFVDLNK